MSNDASLLNITCPHCAVTNRVPEQRLGQNPRCGKCKEPLFTGEPAEWQDSTFSKHVNGTDIPIVVDFWADWCGPCKMMAPEFRKAAAQLEPGVRFAKLDTSANPDTATQFGIRGIPTMIVYKGGKEAGRQSGAMQSAQIVDWIRQYL